MSFRVLPEGCAATVAVNVIAGTCKLVIRLRQSALPEAWRNGIRLEATFGTGNHAGELRLAASGVRALALGFGTKKGKSKVWLHIRLPLPDGVDAMPRPPEPAMISRQPFGLFVELPSWALPRPAAELAA